MILMIELIIFLTMARVWCAWRGRWLGDFWCRGRV